MGANHHMVMQVLGLHPCHLLRELVLDQNKIRQIDPTSFCGLLCLRELSMAENGLRSLNNLWKIPSIRILQLGKWRKCGHWPFLCLYWSELTVGWMGTGNNRVGDLSEVERLAHGGVPDNHRPSEITLQGNPISRKLRYRATLIHVFSSLQVVDGRQVTEDERDRANSVILTPDT